MQNHDDLEQRLASLSLTRPSEAYTHTASQLLRHQAISPARLWAVRLNYALAASLLVSVGFNLLQLRRLPESYNTASSQCEVGNRPPDSAWNPTPAKPNTLQDSRQFLPVTTTQLC